MLLSITMQHAILQREHEKPLTPSHSQYSFVRQQLKLCEQWNLNLHMLCEINNIKIFYTKSPRNLKWKNIKCLTN